MNAIFTLVFLPAGASYQLGFADARGAHPVVELEEHADGGDEPGVDDGATPRATCDAHGTILGVRGGEPATGNAEYSIALRGE
jgi:hypothetical protein